MSFIDRTAIRNLRNLGGDLLIDEMIGSFLDEASTRIAQAWTAERVGDMHGVARAMHPLTSSSALVGATEVRTLAIRLVGDARNLATDSIPSLLGQIEEAFERARSCLEAERQEPRQA